MDKMGQKAPEDLRLSLKGSEKTQEQVHEQMYSRVRNQGTLQGSSGELQQEQTQESSGKLSQNQSQRLLMEAVNGMLVTVPEDRLDSWQKGQKEVEEGTFNPSQRVTDRIVSMIYGKEGDGLSLSAASLGIRNGTSDETISLFPESIWDDEMKTTAQILKDGGYEVTYFAGPMWVKGADGIARMARGVFTGQQIFIQADNRSVTYPADSRP